MNFADLACYASITAGANMDDAFENLVIGLIDKKRYSKIDVQQLSKDFTQEYRFELPYYPMKRTINSLCKKNYLIRTKSKIIANYTNIDKNNFSTICLENQKTYNDLINSFYQYMMKIDNNYTFQKCEDIVELFIRSYGINYYKKHNCDIDITKGDSYFFSLFLQNLNTINSALYNFFDRIVLGRILSELVTYSEEPVETVKTNTKIYLDTDITLILLGIDNTGKHEIIKSLIQDLISLGMKICIYKHTYREVDALILNSLTWINNPSYNSSLATETTYYFISNSFSYEQVHAFYLNTSSRLQEEQVIIEEDYVYPQNLPPNVMFERDIMGLIHKYYKSTNPNFNESENVRTIENDAMSLFLTNYFNHGSTYQRVWDSSHLFLTTNYSLSNISKEISRKNAHNIDSHIPFCVTDMLLGNLVWLNMPAKLIDMNKIRLNSIILSAFNPTTALLTKLNRSLVRLEALGALTPEQCYYLKADKTAHKSLIEIVHGDDNNFTDETPLQLLKKIQMEAKQSGMIEERQRLSSTLSEKDKEVLLSHQKNITLEISEATLLIENRELKIEKVEGDVITLELQVDRMLKSKDKAENSAKRKRLSYIVLLGITYTLFVVAGSFYSFMENGKYFNFFSFIITNAIFLPISLAYQKMTGNEFSPIKWFKNYLPRQAEKEYQKVGFNVSQLKDINEQIQQKKYNLQVLQDEINANHEKIKTLQELENEIKQKIGEQSNELVDSSKECVGAL